MEYLCTTPEELRKALVAIKATQGGDKIICRNVDFSNDNELFYGCVCPPDRVIASFDIPKD